MNERETGIRVKLDEFKYPWITNRSNRGEAGSAGRVDSMETSEELLKIRC